MTLFADPPCARRYEKEFENVQDVFELQRNLNNAFAYDLVPSPSVVIAALRAARRVNDFPTAVRIFEGMFLARRKHRDRNLEHILIPQHRHQRQGREQGPIRRVPPGAAERPGRARRGAQGGALPHQLVNARHQEELCESGFKKTTKIDHAR